MVYIYFIKIKILYSEWKDLQIVWLWKLIGDKSEYSFIDKSSLESSLIDIIIKARIIKRNYLIKYNV